MLIEVVEPMYNLLPASDKGTGGQPIRFSRLDWQPEEIVDATEKRGVMTSKEWLDLLNPSRGLRGIQTASYAFEKRSYRDADGFWNDGNATAER